eukprot:GGOE01050257.1.p1 GENE.GGOE01050257.1~~GGOE01050257.1.p1  ORF type:complete len:315 (+),score=78.81 GGOE01050257.1:63-1007(+)
MEHWGRLLWVGLLLSSLLGEPAQPSLHGGAVTQKSSAPVVTFFTSLKPLTPTTNVTQWNALASWKAQADVHPPPPVYVIGRTKGAEALAAETGSVYLPDVASMGRPPVPVLRAVFHAVEAAEPRSMFYVFCTSDIIFPPDFTQLLLQLRQTFPHFLAIGQRTTIPIRFRLNFSAVSWFKQLRTLARSRYRDTPWAIDYFAFTARFYGDPALLPPLILGRNYVDNWLVQCARRSQQPVVDVTEAALVVHQRHDHSFIKGGTPWRSPESHYNKMTVKRYGGIGSGNILRAPFVLTCRQGRCRLLNRSRTGGSRPRP